MKVLTDTQFFVYYSFTFFKTLKNMGYRVMKTMVFPDHYPYTLKDIIKLKNYKPKILRIEFVKI